MVRRERHISRHFHANISAGLHAPPSIKISSVIVNTGFERGASPGSHSEIPRQGWPLLHCGWRNVFVSCVLRKDDKTCCTRSAVHRDSGRTSTPPSLDVVITGGSYKVVGRFQVKFACSLGSTNFSTGGFTAISATSTIFNARDKLDLPVSCLRAYRFFPIGQVDLHKSQPCGRCNPMQSDVTLKAPQIPLLFQPTLLLRVRMCTSVGGGVSACATFCAWRNSVNANERMNDREKF